MQAHTGKVFLAAIALCSFLFGCHDQNTGAKKANEQSKDNGGTVVKNDTLSCFLLAGVYFINGYGGVDKTYSLVKKNMTKQPGDAGFVEELVNAYAKIMEYPYHRSPAEKIDSRHTLEQWWEVHDAHEFHLLLSALKDKGHQEHYLLCKKILDENGGANADVSKIDLKKYNVEPGTELLLKFVKENDKQFSSSGIKAWDIARYVSVICLGYSAEYIEANDGITLLLQILADARKNYSDWKTYYSDFMLGRKFWGGDVSNNTVYDSVITQMMQGSYSIYKYQPLK